MTTTRPRLFALRQPLPLPVYLAVAAASVATLLGVWCAVGYGQLASPLFVPTPTAVWERLGELHTDGLLWEDLSASVGRIFAGFALATVVAVPLGLLVGNVRFFEALCEPLIGFLRYLPVPAFIPLLILYTGIGETPKILVIFIGTFVQETVMVADVAKQVRADLIRAATVLGATTGEVFTRVIARASLPGIVDVARLNLGFAWTYLVVAELVAANEGLGLRILKSQRFLQTDTIFLYLLIIGVLGLASDLAFKLVHRFAFPWAQERLSA